MAKNYNLLLFDFRYLGESEGRYTGAGAKEKNDLLAAIDFLKNRGINEVGVWGFSLGGAVALMTALEAPQIKVIVSESSYQSLKPMAQELYPIPLLKQPLGAFTSLWAKLLLGVNLADISPAKSAQSLNIPILLIHSQNDATIPFENALSLKKALKNNQRAEFWFPQNLLHGQLGAEHQEKINDFFKKNYNKTS